MSIRDEIARHVEAEVLHEFVDPLGAGRGPRRLFLSNDVLPVTDVERWDESTIGKCFVKANSRFEAYARNDEILFSLRPREKHPRTALARVSPVDLGIVAIRVWDGPDHLRVFGGFSEKDWLVALKWDIREELDFRKAAIECRGIWDSLFNTAPLVGAGIHDYFSDRVSTLKARGK